jgi:hypothetical protein
VKDKATKRVRDPKKGRERIMKKAILFLSVLVVLALLAVPIFAEGLALEEEPNGQMSPVPRLFESPAKREKNLEMSPEPIPGKRRRAEEERNLEMSPAPGIGRRAEKEKNLQMAPLGSSGKPRA